MCIRDRAYTDAGVKAARGGIYASFAHQKMLDTLAEKAACKSKSKKKEEYSEAIVNTPECEKKPEEEKDMRGYYAKINVIKNKLRSMGAKNAMLLADPDEVEKCWDKNKKDDSVKEERTAADPGAPARMGRGAPTPKKEGPKTQKPAPSKGEGPKTEKQAPKSEAGPKTKKPRYNPFKDGRTPTSASQTTGP